MSGLDGLGWPNPKDEPKLKKIMNSQLEIKLAPTPETDAENQRIMESWNTYASDHCKMLELAQKLEREFDHAINRVTVKGERVKVFLDEISLGDPTGADPKISCGLFCMSESDSFSKP